MAETKKKSGRKLKKEVKGVIGFVIVLMVMVAVYIFWHQQTKFDYEENLDTIVLTVDQTNICLKEMTYYVMLVERTGNERAKQYNPDNLNEYWGVYVNQGTEGGYMTDMAAKAAMDYCIRDNIYAMEAGDAGVALAQEELDELKYDAESTYEKMTAREKEMTHLSVADLELIMGKERLSHKYMVMLANAYEEGALEALTHIYDVGGTYYNGLLEKYPVTINEKIWKEIKVGHLTIN